jgi:hypothetical protein
MNLCPVCGYNMPYPANNYHICPCCGTEFGNDDARDTHEELRRRWIDAGAHWFFRNPPIGWSAWSQLAANGYLNLSFYFGEPTVIRGKKYITDQPLVETL